MPTDIRPHMQEWEAEWGKNLDGLCMIWVCHMLQPAMGFIMFYHESDAHARCSYLLTFWMLHLAPNPHRETNVGALHSSFQVLLQTAKSGGLTSGLGREKGRFSDKFFRAGGFNAIFCILLEGQVSIGKNKVLYFASPFYLYHI